MFWFVCRDRAGVNFIAKVVIMVFLLFKRNKSVFDYIILYKRLFKLQALAIKLDLITVVMILVNQLSVSPLFRSLFFLLVMPSHLFLCAEYAMIIINTVAALLILLGGYFFICAERIKESLLGRLDMAMQAQDEVLIQHFRAVVNQITALENGGRIDK